MSRSESGRPGGSLREQDLDGVWKLPRGRHRLPRQVVEAHQRRRLLASVPPVLAEYGYSSLTVRHLIEWAAVSRATFYQHFEDKHACVLAAHAAAFDRLSRAIQAACSARRDWPHGVVAAVAAVLDFAAESPGEARLLLHQTSVVDPPLARQAASAQEQLVGMLRAGRDHCPGAPALLTVTEQALVGATMCVIDAKLSADQADRLPGLAPELGELILIPYVGPEQARQVARAAGRADPAVGLSAPSSQTLPD